MDNFENNSLEIEEPIVVITDEEGNEFYYIEEEVIEIGEDKFAILIPIHDDECDGCAACQGEEEAIVAKMIVDENGENVYINPTEEEFEEILKVYEEE